MAAETTLTCNVDLDADFVHTDKPAATNGRRRLAGHRTSSESIHTTDSQENNHSSRRRSRKLSLSFFGDEARDVLRESGRNMKLTTEMCMFLTPETYHKLSVADLERAMEYVSVSVINLRERLTKLEAENRSVIKRSLRRLSVLGSNDHSLSTINGCREALDELNDLLLQLYEELVRRKNQQEK